MDWGTVLTVGVVILFVVLMMRGCGGMMAGGGCGMGRDSRNGSCDRDRAVQATDSPSRDRPESKRTDKPLA